MGRWETAEAVVVTPTKSRRAEPAKSGKGVISPLSSGSCPERELATKQQRPEVPRAVATSIGQRANSQRNVSSPRKREAGTAGFVIRTSGGVGGRKGRTFLLPDCARQGAHTWEWKSPTHPAGGSVSPTPGVSRVTATLKEAEGKALA